MTEPPGSAEATATATACIILAAGAGRRLGTVAKALLPTADGRSRRSYLAAVSERAAAAGARVQLVVVGPPHGVAVEAEARRLGLAAVVNPDPSRGMASSVAIGFDRALVAFRGAHACLLWPVDHPSVRADTAARVVAASAASAIVVPTYDGRGGHPTSFGRTAWPELVACVDAPDGARSVVRADPARVRRIAVDDPGVIRDVDTADDAR